MDFVPFPKIARLSREAIVTEKIDGTNAGDDLDFEPDEEPTHWMPLPTPPAKQAADDEGEDRCGSEAEPSA